MKILVKMGDGSVATFASVQALGKHYGELADAFLRIAGKERGEAAAAMRGKAEAYSAVSWQLQGAGLE